MTTGQKNFRVGRPGMCGRRLKAFRAGAARMGALSLVMTVLMGCSTMKPSDFENAERTFRIEEYFAGKTMAWGLFEDRFGKVRRQFAVEIEGRKDGDRIILDERFQYADGEKDRRVWTITRTGPYTYEGKADDIIGVARGEARGNALNWNYDMDLKVGDGKLRVHFDDWMFLQPDGVLLNRAHVTKLGIEIGTVTLAFMKKGREGLASADDFNEWQDVREFSEAANR